MEWTMIFDERLFFEAMAALGIAPHSQLNLITDGKIHRYRASGDKSGSENGWYVLYVDGAIPAGAFGSWKTGESTTWCAKSESKLSPAERAAWREAQEQAKRAREAEQKHVHEEARIKVNELWAKAKPAAVGEHPYLLAKGVRPYGLRLMGEMLLVPVRNASGLVTSMQFIGKDGKKRFKTGGEVAGCYFAIGKFDGILLICEGFATGASLREATGHAVAVAFNAGNLLPVALVLREKYPDATLIVCADNDVDTDGNPGLSYAEEAARQIGGMLAVAKFLDHDILRGKRPTDFNDLHQLYGLQEVRGQVDQAAAVAAPAPEQPEVRHTLDDFKRLVEESDDFDFLTDTLIGMLAASDVKKPAKEYLIAQIAKKTTTTKASLLEVLKGYAGGGGGGGQVNGGEDSGARVRDLNLKHALLPVGGRVLVMNREFDPVMERELLTFSSKSDFELRYLNQKVWDNGEQIGLGEYWLNHSERAEFDGMVFSPGKEQPGYVNLWRGWGVEPKAGQCDLYLDFVREVICSGDDDLYLYVMCWCAHMVQCPQVLPETALVLRGREGIGKNTFIDPLADIVGREHYLMLSSLNQVTGRFSGHLANALLIFCNESVWGGDKSAQGVLKSMITEDVQPVEHKGRDLIMVRSYRRMLFATNENWAVPRGADDRRYVVIDVSDAKKGDYAYFNAIREEMKNGGVEALMAYLLAFNLDGWHPRNIPLRLQVSGWELKIRSGGSIVQWWFDMLQQGWIQRQERQYGDEDQLIWPEKCPIDVIQRSYLGWCKSYNISHPEHNVVLGRQVQDWGIRTSRPRASNPDRKLYYLLPGLDEAQAVFSARFSLPPTVWECHDEGQSFG